MITNIIILVIKKDGEKNLRYNIKKPSLFNKKL